MAHGRRHFDRRGMIPQRCLACPRWFVPKSFVHRYCSNACRQLAFYHRWKARYGCPYRRWRHQRAIT